MSEGGLRLNKGVVPVVYVLRSISKYIARNS